MSSFAKMMPVCGFSMALKTSTILRRFALNLLKRHPAKFSLKRKRFKAALDDSFLAQLLQYF
jgi:hypothetical protein